jgi:hypothetical protein
MDNRDAHDALLSSAAHRDFSQARMRAFWAGVWSLVNRKPNELLDFEEVKQRLRLEGGERDLGIQNIPLDKIVGSVGRYNDFTRKFLPRKSVNEDRWRRINALARGAYGLPPIEAYKVGDVYFVIDGNHRVSVARQLKAKTIEAYVREIPTPVEIGPDDTPEEIFRKGAYAEFLRKTRLKQLRPDSNVLLTEPGYYAQILENIDAHQYFKGIDEDREVPYEEAVSSWYDNVYLPMVEAIRKYDLLREFPDRTEADLYVWLIRHQGALRDNYGGEWLSPEETARDFAAKLS